ncbi:unnamed protein product [Calicophoron daubneyi]|uniref:Ribonuclease P/MRP protein subunit POP5 n=1 Tax=Calicophoron daubneyi TaxID=300641 RepID=A0AAV2T212_CALDB
MSTDYGDPHGVFTQDSIDFLPFIYTAKSYTMVRVKYRYLVCFVSIQPTNSHLVPGYPGCKIDDSAVLRTGEGEMLNTIRGSVLKAHGTLGGGHCMARLRVIYWCPVSGLLVLRCLRSQLNALHAALALISSISIGNRERNAVIDVYHISGTIRGSQKFLVSFYSHQLFSRPCEEVQTALSKLVRQQLISSRPPRLMDDT